MCGLFSFMKQIKVKKRTVDPKTGNVTLEPTVVNIGKNHPWNSLEYHKIADELGVSAFDRTTSKTSTRIVTVYNYLANLLQTNDVRKIASAVMDFKKANELGNIEGPVLVDKLYKVVSEENYRVNQKFQDELRAEGLRFLNKKLTDSSSRAKELRESSKVSSKASKETGKQLKDAEVKRTLKKVDKIEVIKRKETTAEPVDL